MPNIILWFFCRGNAIFDCGLQQKYQINNQLCCRPPDNVVPFLFSCATTGETTALAGFLASDGSGCPGRKPVEIIHYVWIDDCELVIRIIQMADCIKTRSVDPFFPGF
jgi:hypothetical protein